MIPLWRSSFPREHAKAKSGRFCYVGLRSSFAGMLFMLILFPLASAIAEDDPLTLTDLTDYVITNYNVIAQTDALRYANALKRAIEDGAAVIDYYMKYHEAGFKEFAGADGTGCPQFPCGIFRDELLIMLQKYQDTLNLTPKALSAYAIVQGLEPLPSLPPADMSQLILVLDSAPAFVLYPLYDALKHLTGDAHETMVRLNAMLDATEEALNSIILVGDSVPADAFSSVNGAACHVLATDIGAEGIVTTSELATAAATLLNVGAGILGVVGELEVLKSMNSITIVETEFSLVGKFASAFNVNMLAFVGNATRVLSKIIEAVGTGVFKLNNRCRLRLNNQVMFCMLTEKNLHSNRQFDTLNTCIENVREGKTAYGF